jgi:hypothetical protein
MTAPDFFAKVEDVEPGGRGEAPRLSPEEGRVARTFTGSALLWGCQKRASLIVELAGTPVYCLGAVPSCGYERRSQ